MIITSIYGDVMEFSNQHGDLPKQSPTFYYRLLRWSRPDPGSQMLETIGDIFQRYLPFVEGISLDFTINTLW